MIRVAVLIRSRDARRFAAAREALAPLVAGEGEPALPVAYAPADPPTHRVFRAAVAASELAGLRARVEQAEATLLDLGVEPGEPLADALAGVGLRLVEEE